MFPGNVVRFDTLSNTYDIKYCDGWEESGVASNHVMARVLPSVQEKRAATMAGIDAGNHCWCGAELDLKSAAARAKNRPLAECQVTPCHADPNQKCGGTNRCAQTESTSARTISRPSECMCKT